MRIDFHSGIIVSLYMLGMVASAGTAMAQGYDCVGGICSGFKTTCVEIDDHGADAYVQSEAKIRNKETGVEEVYTDHCMDNKTLMEYACGPEQEINFIKTTCEGGCKNGACIRTGTEQDSSVRRPNYERFSDIDVDSPEELAVIHLAEQGIIGGYPDGTFKGDNRLNRAEAAKILINSLKIDVYEDVDGPLFSDVPADAWFAPYVSQASSLGVIEGDAGKNTFRPGDEVNTAEFLAMVARAHDMPLHQPHHFTDVAEGDWFNAYAGFAEPYIIFLRRELYLLEPARAMTRYEVAFIIDRVLTSKQSSSE